MKKIKVSVIIPCYNHGNFLKETVNSVLESVFTDYEIIIVNDGSTDDYTRQLFQNYSRPHTKIIHTVNNGLAEARNIGIREAQGEYILPLDADDKISPYYIKEAVDVLDFDSRIGIVYARARKFGAENKIWHLPPYSFEGMLGGNLIYASAFFRKKDWNSVGGYKKEMRNGLEDWEFWLSLIERGVEALQLPGIHFYYRIRKQSMARSINIDSLSDNLKLVYSYHKELFDNNLPNPLEVYHKYLLAKSALRSVDMRLGKFFFSPVKYVIDRFIY